MNKILGLILAIMFSSTAHSAIINLDAETGDKVTLNLEAGVYEVTVIGITGGGDYDAWNAWGQVNCDQQGICVKGFVNNYAITVPNLFTKKIFSDGKRYQTAALALQNAINTSFRLTSTSQVEFWINDSNYSDNYGGISLQVKVPTPAVFSLLLIVLSGLMIARRR